MKTKQLIQKWKEVEFQEIADKNHLYPIGDGDHGQIKPSMYQDHGIPYIRVRDMVGDKISLKNLVYISKEVHQKNIGDELIPGDLLIAKTGATIGKVAIMPDEIKSANTTASIGKITIDKKKVFPKYVLYFMKTRYFINQMWAVSKKSAQPGFNILNLKKFKIPLPPLQVQKTIVQILERAEQVKQKREKADKLMNDYLESVFNKMFLNKGFEEVELGDKKICEISGEYGSGSSAITFDRKIRYIRITDINWDGTLKTSSVSPSKTEKKYLLERGDLLFARTGATVGKTYLHNSDKSNYQYAGYLIRFRFNNNKITPEYVYYFTRTLTYLSWVDSKQKVVAQPNINAKQYSSIKIPLPPLPLQKKFASIVEKVEKIKEKQKQSKREIENLFNVLMQQAFKGELKC